MKALDKIIAQRDEKEYQKVKSRMMIAAKIADAMKERGITQKKLAGMLGKKSSEISRLLTGNHNFSHDTLFEIGYALGIKLLCPEVEEKQKTVRFNEKSTMQIAIRNGIRVGLSGWSRSERYNIIPRMITNNFNLS